MRKFNVSYIIRFPFAVQISAWYLFIYQWISSVLKDTLSQVTYKGIMPLNQYYTQAQVCDAQVKEIKASGKRSNNYSKK